MYQVIIITDEIYNAHIMCKTDDLKIAETYMESFIENNSNEDIHVAIYDKKNNEFRNYTW